MVTLVPNSWGTPLSEENWIAGAIRRPGQLHRDLGVPEGKKIPRGMIVAATKSKDPQLRRRAYLALTLGKITRRHARKVRAEKPAAEE